MVLTAFKPFFWGCPARRAGRAIPQLAIRSALRRLWRLGLPPAAALLQPLSLRRLRRLYAAIWAKKKLASASYSFKNSSCTLSSTFRPNKEAALPAFTAISNKPEELNKQRTSPTACSA